MMPLTETQMERSPQLPTTHEHYVKKTCDTCGRKSFFNPSIETYCPYCGVTVKNREEYPVKTPVTNNGDIIFNAGRQVLKHFYGLYTIEAIPPNETFKDHSDDFIWVQCNREDLKPGDTAYRLGTKNTTFKDPALVCKILNHIKYVFVVGTETIATSRDNFDYWFKLTRKDEK